MAGQLFIVATPIGNLADLTMRAKQTLEEVDLILAEDTRHTHRLLDRYGITTKTASFHEHSSPARLAQVIEQLGSGQTIAFVTDAGTPGISDPGGRLVQAARQAGHLVTPIPGPSAPAALLSVAGLPTDHYLFVGFLPKKKGRQTLLTALKATALQLGWPLVFFESPERIGRTLNDLMTYFSANSSVVVGRELTKQFEEVWVGSLTDAAQHFTTGRGEFVFALWPEK